MRQTELFSKTRREAPKGEEAKNAILLTRAGFIYKEMSGVYDFLPLGLRVLDKIREIIREEMNSIGGQELSLSTLQDKEVWEKTGRWDDKVVDNWFKTELKTGGEVGLATTHEEPLTRILSEHISSYRDLPISIYQFQTKFRNELRAKSGILRGREFLMKDLYSFSKSEEEHRSFYKKVVGAYWNIFERVGIKHLTYKTKASGGQFSDGFSEEFQTLTDAGEDLIYIRDEKEREALNKEVESGEGEPKKAVEVGNIFDLGTKFSEALELQFTDKAGKKSPVIMGSYGIGLGRLMGTVVETLSDDKGMIWPREISPFGVHLLSLTEASKKFADEVYKTLNESGVEVLYDDRDVRAGEKFADSDLMGISTRIIVGDKGAEKKMLEVVDRASGDSRELSLEDAVKEFRQS